MSFPTTSVEPLSAEEVGEIRDSLTPISSSSQRAVYSCYKAALKVSRKQRAGARKQEALAVASGRYGFPVSIVKNIVRVFEHESGTTHEHTKMYVAMSVYSMEASRIGKAGLPDECPECGNNVNSENNPVEVRISPVKLRAEGELLPFTSCFVCYLHAGRKIDFPVYSFREQFPHCFA